MRSMSRFWVLVCLFVGALGQTAVAQNVIVHQKPVHLRHISGVVVDPTGSAIPGAKVELRSAADHHVLQTLFADAQGHFAFPDGLASESVELRASHDLFQIVQYTVALRWFAHGQLRIVLPLGV